MMKHKGRKYIWCLHHASKDGGMNGLYMPHPHDCEAWAKTKAKKTAAFEKCKEEERKKQAGNSPQRSPSRTKPSSLLSAAG